MTDTNFSTLDLEQVIFIHEQIIDYAGGVQGVRDFALLHSGLERCKATFAGEDLYPTIYKKSAALLHSLVMNHAFLDGNKRTAYAVMTRFLNSNGLKIKTTQQKIIDLCLAVDNESMIVGQISQWVEKHTVYNS